MSINKSNGSLASFLDDCVDDDVVIKHEHGERASSHGSDSTNEPMDDVADSFTEQSYRRTPSSSASELSLVLPMSAILAQTPSPEQVQQIDTESSPTSSPTSSTRDGMTSIVRDKPLVKKPRPKQKATVKRTKKPKAKTTARRGRKSKADMDDDAESQRPEINAGFNDIKTSVTKGHSTTDSGRAEDPISKDETLHIACSVASMEKYQFLASNLPFGLAQSIINNPLATGTLALGHCKSVNHVLYEEFCQVPSTCKCNSSRAQISNVNIKVLLNSLTEEQRSALVCFIKHQLFI